MKYFKQVAVVAICCTCSTYAAAQEDPGLKQRVEVLEAQISSVVPELLDRIDEQALRIEELERLLANVRRQPDASGYDTLLLDGMNLQVVNGLGSTFSAFNGLGNVIIGYNRLDGDVRDGIHNLVVGDDHSWRSISSIIAGTDHYVFGGAKAAIGGVSNIVEGVNSTAIGGSNNSALGIDSHVFGGLNNVADTFSTVIGGTNNLADRRSFVIGGVGNQSLNRSMTIFGIENLANERSFIFGGNGNTADRLGTIFHGIDNSGCNDAFLIHGIDNLVTYGTRIEYVSGVVEIPPFPFPTLCDGT